MASADSLIPVANGTFNSGDAWVNTKSNKKKKNKRMMMFKKSLFVLLVCFATVALSVNVAGDGKCSVYQNSAATDYDGGDCCAASCVGSKCGVYGYDCKDPSMYTGGGDGMCSAYHNQAIFEYDGGDCCVGTCVDAEYKCGINGFNCKATGLKCSPMYGSKLGDGRCDPGNNKPACGYDLGDCCESTCSGKCSAFECKDPTVVSVSDTLSCGDMVPVVAWVGDGWCDSAPYNTALCGYDGGDCCVETCDAENTQYGCPNKKFDCVDPAHA
jgi:hypothetical protein